MAKVKYYTVWQGRQAGVYDSWEECAQQVNGAEGAKYKSFATRQEAERALQEGPEKYIVRGEGQRARAAKEKVTDSNKQPIYPALAVDAACSGNPGLMEFRGVIADTGTEVFHRGPYKAGTNNIGEFMAIVLGLAWLQQNHLDWVLYSDSKTAQAWIKKGHAETKLQCTKENIPLFEDLQKAEVWLHTHTWTTQILKWETEIWGEIPADFGRK